MRLLLFFPALLLPQLLRAQSASFELGSYVLREAPGTRHPSLLKLRNSELLLAKDAKGKSIKLIPYQVSSFRMGARKYITAGGCEVRRGKLMPPFSVVQEFVEQLDSGQVVLSRYEYPSEGGGAMPMVGGGMMYGGGGGFNRLYLLQRGDRIYTFPNEGYQAFRAALLPHIASRADLVKLVESTNMTVSELPAILRALNTGQPLNIAPK